MDLPARIPGRKPELIGRTLGDDYVIERRIGGGSMGQVYAARHTRLPARFAIKVLHPEMGGNEELYRRFRHEAEVLSALHHPNLVAVTDFNRLADGTIYLVMELLEGEDLQARLAARGPLPLGEVLHIGHQLGSALAAAHKHGVVHRDLKPQNLFLARQDHGDQIVEVLKVLDFGVSKIRRPADTPGATPMATIDSGEDLTAVGRILGTPQFMAPEQARGQNATIDGRADQFAMAAILYYALGGELPFRGKDPTAVLYQVLYQMPPPVHELAPVPQEVSAVLERALSKSPAARYPSVIELVRALEQAGQRTMVSMQTIPMPASEATVMLGLPPPPKGGECEAVLEWQEVRPAGQRATALLRPPGPSPDTGGRRTALVRARWRPARLGLVGLALVLGFLAAWQLVALLLRALHPSR